MEDWEQALLKRARERGPKEESPFKAFRSLIVLLLLAAIAFFVIYKMGQSRLGGAEKDGEGALARPAAACAQLHQGGGTTINEGGSKHKV